MLAPALLVLALSACKTEVATVLDVSPSGGVAVNLEVRMYGQAADVVSSDPGLAAEIESKMAEASSDGEVRRSGADGSLAWRVRLSPSRLPELSGMTGVREVAAYAEDGGELVAVSLVRPEALVEAVRSAAPDPSAAKTMLSTSGISVTVVFPGRVLSASPDGVEVAGRSAYLYAPLDSDPPEEMLVLGELSRPRWPLWAAAGLLAASALWLARRRGR